MRNTLIRNDPSNCSIIRKHDPLKFSIIRNDVLTNREWIIKMFVIFKKNMPKGWWFNEIKFKSDNSNDLLKKNIEIFLK